MLTRLKYLYTPALCLAVVFLMTQCAIAKSRESVRQVTPLPATVSGCEDINGGVILAHDRSS
jgi:hypothetical protein